MTQILQYNQIDRQQWTELVQTSETGTWFQSPEAYDFFASVPELLTPFAYGVEKDTRLCAVCVGYVTKECNPIRQFFTRRAIITGGPCLANNSLNEEVQLLLSTLRQQLSTRSSAPIYIECRNFNDFSSWKSAFIAAGFAYKPHLNFHVDPAVNKLSDNRKRQLKKSDAISEPARSESEIREWYQVLEKLYRTKVKTPLWPIDFFLSAFRQNIARFLLVKHEGKVIGGSMVVADTRTVYEWFECGLNTQFKDQYPSVLATFAGIQLAHKTNRSRYDMMGAGEPGVPYGVRDFKSEFGGTLVEHGRFLSICKPLLYRLGSFAISLIKRS